MSKAMKLSITLSAIDKLSKPLSAVQQKLGKLGNTNTAKLARGLEGVENRAKKLASLKLSLQQKLDKSAKSAQKLKAEIGKTDKEIKRLGKQKLDLKKKFDAGKISAKAFATQTKKIETSLSSLQRKRISLGEKFQTATHKAESLKRGVKRVDTQVGRLNRKKLSLTEQLRKAGRQADATRAKLKKISGTMAKAGAVGIAVGGLGIKKAVDVVNTYKDVRKAQGDIASLGIDERGIQKITQKAYKMAGKYAEVTAPSFVASSYDIKSGISTLDNEGVAEYTEYSTVTARATKSTVAEMTKLFALGHGIFKNKNESDLEFGKRFAGSIGKAVQAFRTDGSDLTLGISNIGAIGKKMGVSLSEELAVIGHAKSAFASAAEAGTGYRAFLGNAVKAQKQLGLTFVDSHKKLLPMSIILEKIKKKFGKLDAIEMKKLKDSFGSEEAVKIITALVDKTDELAASQKELSAASYADTEKMALARNRGHEFTIMLQKLSVLASKAGKVLSPIFDKIAKKIGTIADKVSILIEKNPMAKWALKAIAGIAAIVTVLGTVSLSISGILFLMSTAGKSFSVFALMTNPLFLVAAAVVAVMVAFGDMQGTLAFLKGAMDGFKSGLSTLKDVLTPLWEWVSKTAKELGKLAEKFGLVSKSADDAGKSAGDFGYRFGQALPTVMAGLLGAKVASKMLGGVFKSLYRIVKPPLKLTAKMPKSAALGGKLKSVIGTLASIARRNPIMLVATIAAGAAVAGLNHMSKNADTLKTRQQEIPASLRVNTQKRFPVSATRDPKFKGTGSLAELLQKQDTSSKKIDIQEVNRTRDLRPKVDTIQTQSSAMQSQFGALQKTVQTIASRPEQHNYNISVTVNNAKSDQDISTAVTRGVEDARQQSQERATYDTM